MNLRQVGDDIVLEILVQPRASRAKLGPWHEGRLKVAVTSPPVDGEANTHVIDLLARALGVAKRNVSIERGDTSRRKTVRLSGVDRASVEALGQ